MAVQAQYPLNLISPDLIISRAENNGDGGGAGPCLVFGDPQSQLAFNGYNYGSRKRNRDDLMAVPFHQFNDLPNNGMVSNTIVQNRLLESSGASTSGRPAQSLLAAHLYNQSLDVDALLRQHSERLCLAIEQSHKRQCRALLSVLEKQFEVRLQEKEAELEKVIQRNAELEENVRQLSVEKEMWQAAAKNSEFLVSGLKASLEHALLGKAPQMNQECRECESTYPAEDEESCCFQGEERDRRTAVGDGAEEVGESQEVQRWCYKACTVCKDDDVCVLLLPCKHLCLCKHCAAIVDACPVCSSPKNASLHVIIPMQ
ncbi:FlgN-like protein [Dioscorea alata]|uniref:FlgN-like protein n=1 Tax=Dioscorea alata TaxID=55571 RepID=A0ACB7W7J7_DIOAL|nr:FlgN-like protein [Dioscorea alata]